MAQKHVVKMSSITQIFVDDMRCFKKGENAYESNHVHNFFYDAALGLVSGEVSASMRNRTYNVQFSINNEDIEEYSCTCPRGTLICHHIAALAFHAHYNISITDKECRWSKKKSGGEEVNTAKSLFPRQHQFVALKKPVTEEQIKQFVNEISQVTVGFSWIVAGEPSKESEEIFTSVEDIIWSKDFITAINKIDYLKQKLIIDSEQIKNICNLTVGQWTNPNWLVARKHRLTASNFGVILRACRRNRYPPSLFKNLTGSYNLDGVNSIQWGRDNEDTAIEAFQNISGKKVQRTGLWMDTCGFLGASPDGIVEGENALVEVKCPFRYREEGLKSTADNYIVKYTSSANQFIVNRDHVYYDQVQGQLHIANKDLCYLVLWTLCQTEIIKINKDDSWKPNLQIIKTFYEKYVDYICGE